MPLHPWSTNEDDASLDDSVSPSPTRGELTMGSGGIRGSILTITKVNYSFCYLESLLKTTPPLPS